MTILLLTLFLLSLAQSVLAIDCDELVLRMPQALMHEKLNTQELFTAIVTSRCAGEVKDGLQQEQWWEYHAHQQLKLRGSYTGGKRRGEWVPYFANRELQLKTEAINDQKNGAWFKYHAYGQSEVNCRLMDGLADGDCNNYNSEDQLYLRVTSVLGECEARGENTKDTSRLLELSSSRRS